MDEKDFERGGLAADHPVEIARKAVDRPQYRGDPYKATRAAAETIREALDG